MKGRTQDMGYVDLYNNSLKAIAVGGSGHVTLIFIFVFFSSFILLYPSTSLALEAQKNSQKDTSKTASPLINLKHDKTADLPPENNLPQLAKDFESNTKEEQLLKDLPDKKDRSNGKPFTQPEDVTFLPNWNISGSNTIRYDRFTAGGNTASSPYQNVGGYWYDEFNLNFSRSFSPFNRVTGQLSGLALNDSPYRNPNNGAVLERFNLKQENGDFGVPYRVEAGDFFAFQSFRTIQRSLKGAHLELQPNLGWGRHSISLFQGSGGTDWNNLKWQDDVTGGVSWLVKNSAFGLFSANYVTNHKKATTFIPQALTQDVFSLAWEKRSKLLSQKMTLEAELGQFIGDHPNNVTGSGLDTHGSSYFAQVSGSPLSLPELGYRVRFEAYDEDYQPNGATVQSNRRSEEGHLSWRFSNGLMANARLQSFRSNWKTTNPLDTVTIGASLSGPFSFIDGLSGNIDAYKQENTSRDLLTNSVTKVVNASMNKSIQNNLSFRTGLYYTDINNKSNPLGNSLTRQVNAGMDYRLKALGFDTSISPGIVGRFLSRPGNTKDKDLNPTLSINARRDAHSLFMTYSYLNQARPQSNFGVSTKTTGVNYRYTKKALSIGMDANWYSRTPDDRTQQNTDALQLGISLTYNFDKPARTRKQERRPEMPRPVETVGHEGSWRLALDLANLAPGMRKDVAVQRVADSGFGIPTEQAGMLVWYARVLKDIDQNQRLVLELGHGYTVRSALIIEFDNMDGVTGIKRIFEKVQRLLLEQYGSPDEFLEEGAFGTNVADDLTANKFIRVMEWKRENGTLRFGIPRRLDGKVRMELQAGKGFPIIKDTLWSMEEIQ